MIDLIKVEGLFFDLDTFFESDGSEEVLELFGAVNRVHDSVGILVNQVDLTVSAVQNHLLFRAFLHLFDSLIYIFFALLSNINS